MYDGSGSRIEQKSVVSGTTSDTAYLLGGVEEVTAGVVTKYLGVAGLPTAIRVGTSGSLNYLASDGLGSVSEALDGAGNVVAAQLYTPYGQIRYTSGTMPTTKGFTGQRADSVSGLDYYGARYYDPVAGQFTTADSANDGLSRYAYVKGNPETFTDPTGKLHVCGTCGDGGHGGGSGGKGDSGDSGSGTGSSWCSIDPYLPGCSRPHLCTEVAGKCAYNPGPTGNSPTAPDCGSKCQTGWEKLQEGFGWLSVQVVGLIAACLIASGGCGAWAIFLGQFMEQSIHEILDGINLLAEAANLSVGDPVMVMIRAARVIVDMAEIALIAVGFLNGSSTLRDAITTIFMKPQDALDVFKAGEAVGEIFSEVIGGGPDKSGVAALIGASGVLRDMFPDMSGDVNDFITSAQAWAAQPQP